MALDFITLLRRMCNVKLMDCLFMGFSLIFLDHGQLKPWIRGTIVPTL